MNIDQLEDFLDDSGIIFLSYCGILTQNLISNMTEALEKETLINNVSLSVSTNIFTIFVELSQNMMNYSKDTANSEDSFNPKGIVLVGYNEQNDSYYILSRNIISVKDKSKILPKLENIKPMNRDEIKQEYRKLRRSGRDKHQCGAGIGFLEIAKRCNNFDFKFNPLEDDKYQFSFQANINNK